MTWIARNRNNTLVVFNDKPVFDGFEYYREEVVESENFIDYGVELPSDADEKLIGRHIDWTDGPVEIELRKIDSQTDSIPKPKLKEDF